MKLVDWLWSNFEPLSFESALDIFGGTGSVSLLLKRQGKTVHYNDLLRWNSIVGTAFVANAGTKLSSDRVDSLLKAAESGRPGFISETFRGIYFTDEENRWLDGIVPAIRAIDCEFERALAFHALFQSCLVKRPYNLFHRKNLSIRTAEVERSFGNKKTWDTPFAVHFRRFVDEANDCVFDNGRRNRATCLDAFDLPVGEHELVYLDPPYTSAKGVSVDYRDFYHFLEGLVGFDEWPGGIDFASKHRRLIRRPNPWSDKNGVSAAFEELIDLHRRSIIAISYRSEGIPSIDDLAALLRRHGKSARIERRLDYRYALSRSANDEVLLLGT